MDLDINISVGNDAEVIDKAQQIRRVIFVNEQNIPLHLDLDGKDEKSYHAIAEINNLSVGTARLSIEDCGKAVLARVAVLPEFRGAGIANQIINLILSYARNLNVKTIEIHAHEYLRSYYELFGFIYEREVEIVGRHQLIKMSLNI